MKRSRKTLFALLLALVMTLGLAATAWATGEVPTDTNPLEKKLSITKVVEKTGDVTPPAETFTFELEDAATEEKHPLDYYGIELLDDLKISTAGTGTFEKTFRFRLSALESVQHWNPSPDAGGNESGRYNKTFLLREQNDNRKAGWQYSDKEYAVTFTYYTREGAMHLTIRDSGADTSHRSAEFTNTYTENLATVEIPFTKTVKLGGNTAPGKTEFTLEIFYIGNSNKDDYKDVTRTAAVTTNGAGSYGGKLVISGPTSQVVQFVSEGFSVREVNNNLSGWTYSDAVWYVLPGDAVDENGIPTKMNIYSTRNGEGAAVEQMTFENTYTYNHTTHARRTPEQPNTPETAITAPKTFDAGVALYGVSALLSLTGTALVIKRKNG